MRSDESRTYEERHLYVTALFLFVSQKEQCTGRGKFKTILIFTKLTNFYGMIEYRCYSFLSGYDGKQKNMRIVLNFEKNNIVRLAVVLIFAFALYYSVDFSIYILITFGVLYFFIKSLRIELKGTWINGIATAVMIGAGSVFTAYLMQYLLLDAQLREKISDSKMRLNILCCLVVYVSVLAVTKKTGLTCCISHIFLMILAGINYFVYLFRGNEFIFSDLRSISTGLSVAGNYEFVLDDRAVYAIFITTLYIAFARKIHIGFRRRFGLAAVCISVAVLSGTYIGAKTENTVTETWEQKGSYRNGYLLNFVLSIRDCFIAEPAGYSEETVKALETQYGKDAKTDTALQEKPTIIVVMNESYSDLSVVGELLTNEEVTPFYHSLTENTLKGYALSSVFGAKTPNSEWEFMTGNSMAFLPGGSVVYQQYISDTPTSIVSDLKNIGYTCVAMHPYYETGWSRNLVYPTLGFDEMYFLDDFDQTKLLRKYVTDRELYESIVKRYESRKANEDLFIMSISMQNHGGYTENYPDFHEQIRTLGASYDDANQYLSLLRESDNALEYLISYFKNVEEPVEIVFFGDHQPSLNNYFYRELNQKGLSGLTTDELENLYTVPFFIWTNYDTDEEEIKITSLNYLSTFALKRAGLALPPYNRFLEDMMEVIPALNSRGYYSVSNGGFVHIEDAVGEEAKWLNRYEILQYNNMFDRKNQSRFFFPYLEETESD